MSLEENKAIIRKVIEALNKQDLSLADDLVAPNYFDYITKQGLEWHKKSLAMFYKGFPDYHRTIEDIIAEGDKVWVDSTTTMTHTGEFRGLAPTGKKVTTTGVNIYRIVDGKMVEGWSVTDSTNLLKQLGIIRYTEKAKKIFPEDVP